MIFTYNREHIGDALMVIVENGKGTRLDYERKDNVSHAFLKKSNETVAWSIFEVSNSVIVEGVGRVTLSDQSVTILNAELAKEDFAKQLENDPSLKFVVGQIKEVVAHPGSGRLDICQVRTSDDKTVQIAADTPNAAVDLKAIVALPDAMISNGNLISSGVLRDEESFGIVCSPYELALPNAPQKRGITRLDDTIVAGEAFNPEKCRKG